MPIIRQSLVAHLTRLYPLYSGCDIFANNSFIRNIVGDSNDCALLSHVPGREILALKTTMLDVQRFTLVTSIKITWICAQIVRPGDTVLDIGANISIVTLWLSTLVGKSGKVHAFEPNPELQKLLQQTINHNEVSNAHLRIPRVNASAGSLLAVSADRCSLNC